jgi:hypothetical protein
MVDGLDTEVIENREEEAERIVLCVGLDGILLQVDSLHENFLRALCSSPMAALKALALLWEGKAVFERGLP